jgi:hypothetical protein
LYIWIRISRLSNRDEKHRVFFVDHPNTSSLRP